jgi:ATP-dependent RNA helicase DDX27
VEKNKKENTGLSLVDLGYRRLKAAEAMKKALDAGKIVQKKAGKKSKPPPERTQSRTEEMRELFRRDMSERKQKRSSGTRNRKSKNSFKRKSRYKSA